MHIAYCTNLRLPTERAHGHQVASVCDALVSLGHDVTIFAPYRNNPVHDSFVEYYGVSKNIQLQYLGSFDAIRSMFTPGVMGLFVQNALLRRNLKRALRESPYDVVYTRTPALLSPLLASGKPVVIELHALPRRGIRSFVKQCNRCKLVVCLTPAMREALVRLGVAKQKVIVEGDAVDLERFQKSEPGNPESFHLDPVLNIIGYAGQLQSMGLSKGIEVLLDAFTLLRQGGNDVQLAIAGGPLDLIDGLRKRVPEHYRRYVHFVGQLPRTRIPGFLKLCDVLVYPAPKSDHSFFMRDTSPLKLYEYAAVGKPIVAANIPALQGVLTDAHAMLVEPGNAEQLADGIEKLLHDSDVAHTKIVAASQWIANHTWEKRMSRIMDQCTVL